MRYRAKELVSVLLEKGEQDRVRTIFKDPVHNIIPVNDFEYVLLQHPILNRLHGIKQLGFTFYVYPQAKHSRFEHSIGVMHIAGKMADAIRANSPEKLSSLIRRGGSFRDFKQVARLAGLLHDVGHLPYSHVTEMLLFESISAGKASSELEKVFSEAKERKLKLHEYYSCLFTKKLAGSFKKDKSFKKLAKYLTSASHVLCNENKGDPFLSPLGVNVVRKLISGSILDADRVDYLARDAYNTGSTYGIIDIERIISGLGLASFENELVLSIPSKLLSSIEELYYARYMMYKWVYFHHKAISLDLTYREALSEISNNWDKLRRRLSRLFPSMPANFWDLFLPSCIWNSSVKFGYKIDDSFIDLILKIAASSEISPLSSISKGLINRKVLFHSVIKREEDIATLVGSATGKAEEDSMSFLESLSSAFLLLSRNEKDFCVRFSKELNIEVERCCQSTALPNEILSCLAKEYIEAKARRSGLSIPSLTAYVSFPISGEGIDSSNLILLSNGQVYPAVKSSEMLREIIKMSSKPLFYIYASEKPGERAREAIKSSVASFLKELKMAVSRIEGGGDSEGLPGDAGVRTEQSRYKRNESGSLGKGAPDS